MWPMSELWYCLNDSKQRLRHIRVEDEACDVLFGHSGQLVRENILKAHQPHQNLLVRLLVEGVTNDMKLYHASSLFQPCSLISCRVSREETGLTDENDKRLKNSLLPSGLCFLSWMVFSHRLVLLQCKTQFTTPSNFSVTFKLPLVTTTTYRTKLTDCVPLARAWQQDPWWWTWPH